LTKDEVRFAFFPAGNENTASSRINVYTTARILQKRGIPFSFGSSSQANVYYIQKKVTPEILRAARRAKKEGKGVVYLIDDIGWALSYWTPPRLLRRMVRLADVVLTSTPELAGLLASKHGIRKTTIVPPCVDYYPEAPARLPVKDSKPLRVFWFGSSGNFRGFERYLRVLLTVSDVQVVICMEQAAEYLVSKYSQVEFRAWSLSDFVSILQSCHITCLNHDATPIDAGKTNNKMITSIGWGVPAIVTPTGDYYRTARAAGVEYCLFSNEDELKGVVETFRSPEVRERYIDTAQPFIWSKQSPDAVTDIMLNMAANVKAANSFGRFFQLIGSYL
jgi:hypothetical protein